jgi:hypothetical protein
MGSKYKSYWNTQGLNAELTKFERLREEVNTELATEHEYDSRMQLLSKRNNYIAKIAAVRFKMECKRTGRPYLGDGEGIPTGKPGTSGNHYRNKNN